MEHVPAIRQPREGRWTWDDFVALADDDRRELIDGDLVEVEVPTATHESIVATLIGYLFPWARAHQARVLASGYKVRISPKRGVMPDVQLYRHGNLPVAQEQGLAHGHPDLAIEVISPASRHYDRMTKHNYYASIQVPEYWIIDPEAETLERLVLLGGAYVLKEVTGGKKVFRPSSFTGLAIPLTELWASSDEATAPHPAARKPARSPRPRKRTAST